MAYVCVFVLLLWFYIMVVCFGLLLGGFGVGLLVGEFEVGLGLVWAGWVPCLRFGCLAWFVLGLSFCLGLFVA